MEKWEAKRGEIWNRVLELGFKSVEVTRFWKLRDLPVRVTPEERRRQSFIGAPPVLNSGELKQKPFYKMSAIFMEEGEKVIC